MSTWVTQVLWGVALLAVLLASLEVGFRAGRSRADGKVDSSTMGAVLGGMLGLLGLLLGFAFAGASSRFVEREHLLVREANSVGTLYLRAGLLPDPHAARVRELVRSYLDERLTLAREREASAEGAIRQGLDRSLTGVWDAAAAGVAQRPDLTMIVLPAVNDVIDSLAERNAASVRHLPVPVMGLLVLCAALALGAIGFADGSFDRRRGGMPVAFAILVGVALWTTLDLDHPRSGLIRASVAPLEDARQSLRAEVPGVSGASSEGR